MILTPLETNRGRRTNWFRCPDNETALLLHGDLDKMQPPYLRTWFRPPPAGDNVVYRKPEVQEYFEMSVDTDKYLSEEDFNRLKEELEIKYPYSFEPTLKHLAVYGKKVYMEFVELAIKKGWLRDDHLPTTL